MRLWASKDRYTVWEKSYATTLADGTTHYVSVEKVRVRFPSRQQLQKTEFAMRVIPSNIRLVDRTGFVHNTVYYIFSESFWGGSGSKGDVLGGFNTGRMIEVYETGYRNQMLQLRKAGFKPLKEGT